jgi:8-oxo-dGTP diphosphatase
MKEEIGIDLENFRLFREYEFEDRIESVFLSFCSYSTDDLTLTEGQALKWFSEKEAEETELAYGFNRVVSDYYMCLSENKGRNGVSR